MALYIPYIFGSTVSALLGKVAYDYLNISNNDSENKKDLIDIEDINGEYDLILEKDLKNKAEYKLGKNYREKTIKIISICRNECNLRVYNNNKKATTKKIKKLIEEYEILGHEEFINKFKRIPKSNNPN